MPLPRLTPRYYALHSMHMQHEAWCYTITLIVIIKTRIFLNTGLLKVGDNIVEVNNEDVGHLTLEDLQDILVKLALFPGDVKQ